MGKNFPLWKIQTIRFLNPGKQAGVFCILKNVGTSFEPINIIYPYPGVIATEESRLPGKFGYMVIGRQNAGNNKCLKTEEWS